MRADAFRFVYLQGNSILQFNCSYPRAYGHLLCHFVIRRHYAEVIQVGCFSSPVQNSNRHKYSDLFSYPTVRL